VIGIIAVLVAILLPALGAAREQARKSKCLSNLRQLAMAFTMYTDENQGRFPGAAVFSAPTPQDWLWYQQVPFAARTVADPTQSPIVKYLGGYNAEYFRCPSDLNYNQRFVVNYGSSYPYSYDMNYLLANSPFWWSAYTAPLMSGVRNSSEKILLAEIEPDWLEDGCWTPPMVDPDDPNDWENNPLPQGPFELLCTRHDRPKAYADPFPPFTAANFPNYDLRGNVAFADGHAEFVSRRYAHDPRHLDPSR